MLPLFCQFMNNCIGKCFPTSTLMRCRLVSLNRESGIQKQNSLLRPSSQISTSRNRDSQIALDLLENILKRRGKRNLIINRETKPMRLTRLVIGILPQNNDLYLVERASIESRKNLATGRINRFSSIFVPYKSRRGGGVSGAGGPLLAPALHRQGDGRAA